MDNLMRYPKGYLVRAIGAANAAPGVTIANCSEDRVIAGLYKLYVSTDSPWRKWNFKRTVIEAVSRLFGDMYYWLELQYVQNDCVYGYNLDFLEDMVRYIRTGNRNMSLTTWRAMLLEYPEPTVGSANMQRFKGLRLSSPTEMSDAISQWCQWADGFDDMLTTVSILFGTPRIIMQSKIDTAET